jgi:drug/metabolite transporter (DMT)-like permease
MLSALKAPLDRQPVALGYFAALAAVIVTAAYPAVTRVSVTTTLTPADLLMLRFGVSALFFAPYLLWRAGGIPRRVWSVGLPLSFFQGWGMAGCAIFGLQYAPASHSAALGPGTISVWIAALGFLCYKSKVDRAKALAIGIIVAGIVLILSSSFGGLSTAQAVTGDAMFLAASILGAAYLVYLQQHRFDPVLGAALVSTYSAVILLPWYLLAAKSALVAAPIAEIAWQVIFQGILMGCGVFLAINYAVLKLGSQTAGVLFALVPALGLVSSLIITSDPVSPVEWAAIAAISAGVAVGARPKQIKIVSRPAPA